MHRELEHLECIFQGLLLGSYPSQKLDGGSANERTKSPIVILRAAAAAEAAAAALAKGTHGSGITILNAVKTRMLNCLTLQV